MSALRSALHEKDGVQARALIWRRLSGDHLDIPFDPASGESPTDYLRYLHGSGQAESLERAFAALLVETVPAAVEAMAAKPSAAEAARLCEFLRLLELTGFADRTGALALVCERLMFLPRAGELFVTLQLVAFKTYVALDLEGRDRLLTLFSPALDRPTLLPSYCIEAAKANPEVFLGPVSRHLIPEIAHGPELSDDDLEFLAEAVRIAGSELQQREESETRLIALFDDYFAHAAQAARTRNGPVIRSAVLRGLSRSSLPALYIRNFEAAFWDAYPQANATLSRTAGRTALRTWLHGQLHAPTLDHSVGLGLNGVPYGEAGLFRLLSIVLRTGWDFRLHIVHDDYSEVGTYLSDGSLSLAVHNNSLLRQLNAGAEGSCPVLVSPPLLTFRNYDVLASYAALRASIACDGLPDSARNLASRLLDGGELDPIREDGGSDADLLALMKRHGVYFLKNTDTHEVALLATGARADELDDDEPYIVSAINPDEGLERLLDGRVIFYFGGAIQSNYALKNCANRVSRAARLEMATELSFYVPAHHYDDPKRKATYDFILEAWNVTRDLWRILRHQELVPKQWADARLALRDEIMIEVNRPQDMPNGFVSSFDDLFDLIREHDIIHTMPAKACFRAPADPARPVVVDIEEARAS